MLRTAVLALAALLLTHAFQSLSSGHTMTQLQRERLATPRFLGHRPSHQAIQGLDLPPTFQFQSHWLATGALLSLATVTILACALRRA